MVIPPRCHLKAAVIKVLSKRHWNALRKTVHKLTIAPLSAGAVAKISPRQVVTNAECGKHSQQKKCYTRTETNAPVPQLSNSVRIYMCFHLRQSHVTLRCATQFSELTFFVRRRRRHFAAALYHRHSCQSPIMFLDDRARWRPTTLRWPCVRQHLGQVEDHCVDL